MLVIPNNVSTLDKKCNYLSFFKIMTEIKTTEELHEILIGMAKSFHQICEEEKIPYYMVAGTLLGAVRHKGFIPWDDDMDFGVPRQYFDQVKSALSKKLPTKYSLYSRDDGVIASGILKIADNRTVQSHSWDTNASKEIGVNIDIFPIDIVNHKWKRLLIDYLLKIQGYKIFDASVRPWHKKIVAYLIKGILFWINTDKIVDFIENNLIERDGAYISNTYGVYGLKEVMPNEYIGKPILMPFENTYFYGVAKPHEYLRHLYGDYMKLPPENKRHTHILNMYWNV